MTPIWVLVFRIPVKSRCCPSSTMNVIQNTVGETMSKYLYVLVAICNFEANNRAPPFKWRNALFLLGLLHSFVCVAKTSKVCAVLLVACSFYKYQSFFNIIASMEYVRDHICSRNVNIPMVLNQNRIHCKFVIDPIHVLVIFANSNPCYP